MYFVDERSVHFTKMAEYRANLPIMTCSKIRKTIKFLETIVIDRTGIFPVTAN